MSLLRRTRDRTIAVRKSRGRRLLPFIVGAILAATFVVVIPSAMAVHDEGLFELDHNVAASAAPGDDWSTIFAGTSSTALASVFVPDPANTTADNILFAGNTKDDLDLSGWQCNTGKPQAKDDLVDAFAAAYRQTSGANAGKTFVYFGADKFDTSGDAQIAFWFFLNPVGCTPGGGGGGTSFTGTHTVGDLLVISDFTNGGSISTIKVYRWDPAHADTNGTLDFLNQFTDCGASAAGDDACAVVNDTAGETPPWPYTDKDGSHSYQEGAFYEGGINLSDLLPQGVSVPCNGTFLAETRSSQAVDSALQDFALGAFNLCPDLKLDKTPDTGSFFVGDQFNWNLKVTNSGAAAPNTVVTDTVPTGLQIVGTPTYDVDPNTAGGTGTCGVVAQVVTCNIGTLAASDGNTTGPEPDTATVTIKVKALSSAIPAGTDAACANVVNTGSVSTTGEVSTGDNSDTGTVSVCRLAASKTASTSLTRTYNWSVEKSATPTSKSMFDGDTQAVHWPITVTNTGSTDSNWAVSGSITVTNPSSSAATINSISDVLTVALNATVTCPGGFPATVPAKSGGTNGTLVCTYSRSLPDGTDRTNTATATQQNYDYSSGSAVASGTTDYSGTAPVSFASPTVNDVNKTVTLKDSLEGAAETTVGADITAPTSPVNRSIDSSYTCPAGGGKHTNVANLYRSGTSVLLATDDADTTITCYQLNVTKTATTALTKTHHWSVTKDVTPTSKSMFNGDSQTVDWSIHVHYDGATDSGFGVSGSITIHNPAPIAATINTVTDSMTGGVNGTVTCPGGLPHDIAANSDLVCSYTAAPPNGDTRTNTATATQQNHNYASDGTATNAGTTNYSGQAAVDFSKATATEVNKTVTLKDSLEGGAETTLDTTTAPNDLTTGFSSKYTCPAGGGSHTNVARIYGDNNTLLDDDDATTTIACYQLTTSKTATPYFERLWTWAVDKVATGSDGTLTLQPGESFLQQYQVTYTATKHDSAFAVNGSITVHNPAPVSATVNSLTDLVSGGISGTVSCPGSFPETIAAGGDLVCTYTAALPDATARTNKATATQQNYDYASDGTSTAAGTTNYASSDVAFSFAGHAPDVETDESITVSDTFTSSLPPNTTLCTGLNTPIAGCLAGSPPSGTVNAADSPKTFTYYVFIGPYAANDCGDHNVDNTASFITNDTKTTGSDPNHILVTVPCPQGCTLTQGYWKTHSHKGPAPFDKTWDMIEILAGEPLAPKYAPGNSNGIQEAQDEPFFLSGGTWYTVFWQPPSGGNAYYQLAHQYEAAVLNVLSGADPSAISGTLDSALSLLTTYTPTQIGKLKGSDPLRAQFINLAGILGSYNTGTIGPGHCDEDRLSSNSP